MHATSRVSVAVGVGVRVPVGKGVLVRVPVGVSVLVEVFVGELVDDGLVVAVAVGVDVWDGTRVDVAVIAGGAEVAVSVGGGGTCCAGIGSQPRSSIVKVIPVAIKPALLIVPPSLTGFYMPERKVPLSTPKEALVTFREGNGLFSPIILSLFALDVKAV